MSENKLRKRNEIPVEDTWCLEDMYATDELWEAEQQKLEQLADEIAEYKGTLAENGAKLLGFFEKSDEIAYYRSRVTVYANQRNHQDTAVSKYQGYVAKAEHASVKTAAAMSFAKPEILDIPEKRLQELMDEEPKLKKYERCLQEILRAKPHTLSEAEEKLIAMAGEALSGAENTFSMLNNADIKFPTIRDVEGNRIPLTNGNFVVLEKNKDRSLRKQAFEGLYHTYEKLGNTIASIYLNQVNANEFYATAAKYPSARAMFLDEGNIPEQVYDSLIEAVHAHLPAVHRYVGLRKKLLGVDKLHMYDSYVPIVESVEHKYTFEEAKEIVLKALAPMGEEYIAILQEGFDNRWIDVYQNENKRTGAYSWGAYGTHPYVLLNFQGDLDSVFTLAHEMGHAIHTYYSDKMQDITYSGYLIFVAEVASTCNESLLMHYLLENTDDPKERRYLINHFLESFRATVFRQTMFAEFEKLVHEKKEAGEPLTKEVLNQIYHDLVVLYFGPEMVVDEEIDCEWMRIPHFYTSFYVYQYATGYSAATAFSKKILSEGKSAVDAYVSNFLSGGCSKDPIDLLKAAGVDMSTPKPVEDALSVFEEYLALFEQQI